MKSLLIVDDNPDMRQILVDILQSYFLIEGALATGEAAMSEAKRLNPDIILLDVSLGDISGFSLAERLREVGCEAKIVFVSVHENLSFVARALRLGASGYIFKSQIARDLVIGLDAVSRGEQFVSSPIDEAED